MKWRKLSNYCIRSEGGRFRIAKWVSQGKDMYLLSDGNETVGWYRDASKAKDKAEELAK